MPKVGLKTVWQMQRPRTNAPDQACKDAFQQTHHQQKQRQNHQLQRHAFGNYYHRQDYYRQQRRHQGCRRRVQPLRPRRVQQETSSCIARSAQGPCVVRKSWFGSSVTISKMALRCTSCSSQKGKFPRRSRARRRRRRGRKSHGHARIAAPGSETLGQRVSISLRLQLSSHNRFCWLGMHLATM